METPDKALSDLVDIVKSWIPRHTEPANVSRDFWMPDHSCRVCYECDSQFTIFNRRHHCRLCGRVFCGRCTANCVPVPSCKPKSFREEGERIRVCNFCFKQWEQDVLAAQNGIRTPSEALSPTFSTMSLASTKSSSTINGSSLTVGSMSYSTGLYQRVPYDSSPGRGQPVEIEPGSHKQEARILGRNADSIAGIGEPSPNQFRFCMNRSDDDEEEYGAGRSDSEIQHFHHSDVYYGPVEFEETIEDYHSEMHSVEESNHAIEIFSPLHDDLEAHDCIRADKMEEDAAPESSYDDNPSSSIYNMEEESSEPVDFENNGLLWVPPEPEPEDEEDEIEVCPLDDEDEEARGEPGYLRSSNSFGSGEYQSRDRTSEERKRAMKNVVDGHFRALIAQLLQVENIPVGEEDDKESWLEIITSLSWEAATLLKPDTSKGGGMDPGGYVKVKCIASGHRSQSMVVRGIVCKKNVAHRRMASKVQNPRFLILGGALEYQRVTNSLSSFDTLLQQEMDHLKMAVSKIGAHEPHVLLVEKSVSRFAQEYLLAKDVSLVLNIKRPLLERIARCTGAQIVPSIDHLATPKLGYCEFFHVEKFSEEHGSAGQGGKKMVKTLMFFEGCPRPLGCTVLLRGGISDELKKVKHVIQYGVFAAYHLAVETSFLADEGASLPELPLKSPIAVALPHKPSYIDRSISTIPGFTTPASDKPQLTIDLQRLNTDLPTLTLSNHEEMEGTVSLYSSNQSLLTAEPASSFSSPLGMKKSSLGKKDQTSTLPGFVSLSSRQYSPSRSTRERHKVCFGETGEAEAITNDQQTASPDAVVQNSCGNSTEILKRSDVMANDTLIQNHDVIGKQLNSLDLTNLQPNNDQRNEQALPKEEFPSSDHQSILVSLSTRSVWKGTVCERSHLFRIKYYGSFDKPLGRFLRDHLFDQTSKCRLCEMPAEAHVHCYTHRQGSLTISVRKLPEILLPGERDGKIWMWHRCLRCPRINGFPPATRRVMMSDAAWGLSFGKFLELSFSNHAAASRVASCGHSLHRDCLRFYGFGKMVVCFRYASIDVHSVCLPPHRLDFSYENQEWMQKEADEVAHSTELLFDEVSNALQQNEEGTYNSLCLDGNVTQELSELERILQKEKMEFEESLQKLLNREVSKEQPVIDILEVNKLRRQLLFQSYLWDQRLIFAAGSGSNTHETLSGLLTRDKEKLCPMEKLSEFNLASNSQRSITSSDFTLSDSRIYEPLKGDIHAFNHQEVHCDLLSNSIVGQQRIDMEVGSFQGKQGKIFLSTRTSASDQLDPLECGLVARRTLSEGQFPVLTNLSATFDAKWTGEESGRAPADTSRSDSPASVEAIAAMSEDSEERSGAEVTHSFTTAFLSKLGDSAEDFSSWIGLPFLSVYRSINKNLSISPRFDSLSEYNPVYVSLFRELEQQGGGRLLLPVGVNDTVVPVYDDEPTSIISYALVSPDYHIQISDERERIRDGVDSSFLLSSSDLGNFHLSPSIDEISSEQFRSFGLNEDGILSLSGSRSSLGLDPLASTKAMHARVSFTDEGPLGKVKYTVTCYYAKRFDALRRTCCPSELDYIRSLSRCKKWRAQGGKSNVFFAKSLDDRFIIKQVTKTELESFIKFAPEYFKYLSESIGTGSPTCLAKILGIYQVTSKHLKGGKELKMDVLVMENLLFRRSVTRLYDLKGSSRSRYNPDSSGNNKVLLDQNLIEAMPTSPIFVGNKAKRLLERAVWNDTSFLASVDVMDYSLLVGVDEIKHELVVGIIDFMRQYTWDKHLETWVKASGILGGPKNVSPTVISPKQYKKRFRKAMSAYFLVVPDQWSPPTIVPTRVQQDTNGDNQQDASLEPCDSLPV